MTPGTAALVLAAVLAGWLMPARAELHTGPGRVPFWLELASRQQLDPQAMRLVAADAAVVVLRPGPKESESAEPFSALVSRLRAAAPATPVLLYSWASRYRTKGRRGDQIMDWLAAEPELQVRSPNGKPMKSFGDVTRGEYRERTCAAVARGIDEAGADGVALDLAVRTPNAVPEPLARRCQTEPEFCERYAQGMDALFGQLRVSLGQRPIIYNGLWNFGAGMVDDQAKLLHHADAAIVEYFGLNPLENKQGFAEHILPYLRAMRGLPEGKRLFVYGRGPWHYTDYEADYRWQRYLYAAYLLAAGPNTYFKYHASFQVPAHAGRAGGLDTYADWKLPLGDPADDYQLRDGVYFRAFQHGLVLVAPDDGRAGSFRLDKTMYSPEGEKLRGKLVLAPGTGMILLDRPPPPPVQSDTVPLMPLQQWQAARWIEEGEGEGYLSLDQANVGEHDLLLDNVRQLDPAPVLHLRLRPHSKAARLLIVAEVDDPKRQVESVVLVNQVGGEQASTIQPLPRYRAPSIQRYKAPFFSGPALNPGEWQEFRLDVRKVSLGRFTLRGWRYLRVEGRMDMARVGLWRSEHQ